MVTTLATTKICVPRLRNNLVQRKKLVENLQAGLFCPLTLISAPAGYGKTTLLAELAAHIPVTWLSLDDGDNDPISSGLILFRLCNQEAHRLECWNYKCF
jgi:LuxR family transcriptional regulator, maltose regulon positive regulatory protein